MPHAPPHGAHLPHQEHRFQYSETILDRCRSLHSWVLVAFVSRAMPDSSVLTAAVSHPLGFTHPGMTPTSGTS